jgi:hypothetical protein
VSLQTRANQTALAAIEVCYEADVIGRLLRAEVDSNSTSTATVQACGAGVRLCSSFANKQSMHDNQTLRLLQRGFHELALWALFPNKSQGTAGVDCQCSFNTRQASFQQQQMLMLSETGFPRPDSRMTGCCSGTNELMQGAG